MGIEVEMVFGVVEGNRIVRTARFTDPTFHIEHAKGLKLPTLSLLHLQAKLITRLQVPSFLPELPNMKTLC